MRPQFRAWNKHTKEMWIGGFWIFCGQVYADTEDGPDMDTINEDLILTQFTGLYDHRGRKIFAGDIVKNGLGDVYLIESCPGGFQCRTREGLWSIAVLNPSDEVIGNIYENPELLK